MDSLAQSFLTCAKQWGNGVASEEYRLAHMQLQDEPNDHCFAKCLWTESHQYDETTKSIDVSKLVGDLTSRGFPVPQHLLDLHEPTDGSCQAIFEKTRQFIISEMSNYGQ